MDILVEFMEKYLQETRRTFEKLILSEMITYNLLWTLRLGRSYKINGREINNLIRTAAALAEHEGVALAELHIETVYGLNTMVQTIYPE
jgi:hypothetical protein